MDQSHLLILSKFSFLILLEKIARCAAAGAEAVLAAVALEMVFRADVTSLNDGENKRETNAGHCAIKHTVAIAVGVAAHVVVILNSVMSATISHAGAPPGEAA